MIYETPESIRRILKASPNSSEDAGAFAVVLEAAAENWCRTRKSISMQGQKGALDWLEFETDLWELGESSRKILKVRSKWRKSEELMKAIAKIVSDGRFGKGRQPFVELLARYGGPQYHSILVRVAAEPELCGHAVKGLRLANVPNAQTVVEEILLTAQPAWVKREARKYLQRFG